MSKLVYKCMTKAVDSPGDQMKYGPNWTFSRRGILKVYDDHLECRDWYIENHQIKNAVLFSLKYFFLPGYVLRIQTNEKTYHFGLNGNRFWKNDLPFPVIREKGKLRYSVSSILIRLFIAAYIVWQIWLYLSR